MIAYLAPSRVAEMTLKAVENGAPFSLVRMGDGENSLLQFPEYCAEARIEYVFRRALGNKHFPKEQILSIRQEFLAAIENADTIGLFDSSHQNILCRIYREHIDNISFKNGASFCTPGIHFYFQQTGHLRTLVNAARRVVLITGRDVLERVQASFPSKQIEQILLPSEYDYRLTSEEGRGEHYPDAFENIKSNLKGGAESLVLVGGGFLGKIYCNWARSLGAVALDIGSVFDYWAEIPTREGYLTVRDGTLSLQRPSFRASMTLDAPLTGATEHSLATPIAEMHTVHESPIGYVKKFSTPNLKVAIDEILEKAESVHCPDRFLPYAALLIWAKIYGLDDIPYVGNLDHPGTIFASKHPRCYRELTRLRSVEDLSTGHSLAVMQSKHEATSTEIDWLLKICLKKPRSVFFRDFRVYEMVRDGFIKSGYTEVDLKLVTASKFGDHAGFIFNDSCQSEKMSGSWREEKKIINLVSGPSHTIRWQWHRRDGVVPGALSADKIFGIGDAPVWSRTLLEQSFSALGKTGNLTLLVPDFRFGNGIVLDSTASEGPLLQDGFLGINPAALTTENDRLMLKRGMDALRLWRQRFGERAQYVFWCLFGRQVHDRLAGKYIGEGRYHHPVFNYDEITAALPDLEIVDLSPLLRRPMHDVRRLFIDTSSHPSQVGYLLLNGLLFDGLDAVTAYDRAVATVEEDLVALAQKARKKAGKPVLLTGRSIWLDVLMQILGATGVAKLAETGLVLVPLDRHPGQPEPAEMLQRYPLASCQAFVVSAGGVDLSALLDRLFGTAPGFWHSQPCLDWESATEAIIRQRGETPQFIRINAQLPSIVSAIRLNLPAHAVEQGPLGMPSWSGIVTVLQALAEKLPALPTWRIEGEVLLTRDNIAFLIGGNHAVLKFATGELSPSAKSLAAFRANIVSRVALAENIRCPYLHVIFPDKHSVLRNDFPITPLHRLGDAYMAQLGPALKAHVLWPADQLKLETENPYLPLDTHMTDRGSLAVLRMMLQEIGMEANVALDRISSRIVRPQRWQGDLGSKFDPPLFQEGLLLEPDWPQKKFCCPGDFNDGIVDIALNTEALANKTVLLFGDSFFQMMLGHLSAVFSRVICLRTRFLHPEMVTLIKPDVVFTGNAEQYLSNVIPDTEAHAFALYPYLGGAPNLNMDDQFLKAWAAVTAPDSEQSKRFFAELGFEARAPKFN